LTSSARVPSHPRSLLRLDGCLSSGSCGSLLLARLPPPLALVSASPIAASTLVRAVQFRSGVYVLTFAIVCGATQGIAALSFLLWIMCAYPGYCYSVVRWPDDAFAVLGYVITLLAFAIRAAQAGQNIWLTDVKRIHWMQGSVNYEKPNLASPNPAVGAYPPGGHPGNVASPVTPQPQYYPPGSTMGHTPAPVTPQPQYYPQQGTYQV
jgi:hypothetical protein